MDKPISLKHHSRYNMGLVLKQLNVLDNRLYLTNNNTN